MTKKIINVLLSVMLVLVSFGTFTDFSVQAEETIKIESGAVFKIGDTVDFGDAGVYIIADERNTGSGQQEKTGSYVISYEGCTDNGQHHFILTSTENNEDRFAVLITGESGTPAGFEAAGEGTSDNPYRFEAVFPAEPEEIQDGTDLSDLNDGESQQVSETVMPEEIPDVTDTESSRDTAIAEADENETVTEDHAEEDTVTDETGDEDGWDHSEDTGILTAAKQGESIGIGTVWMIGESIDLTGEYFIFDDASPELCLTAANTGTIPEPDYLDSSSQWRFEKVIKGEILDGMTMDINITVKIPAGRTADDTPVGIRIKDGQGTQENPFLFEPVYYVASITEGETTVFLTNPANGSVMMRTER